MTRRRLAVIVFLLWPLHRPLLRWLYRRCLKRIDKLERSLFPEWFAPASIPRPPKKQIAPKKGAISSLLSDYYGPVFKCGSCGKQGMRLHLDSWVIGTGTRIVHASCKNCNKHYAQHLQTTGDSQHLLNQVRQFAAYVEAQRDNGPLIRP